MSAKRIIFDSVLFLYTLVLLAYGSTQLAIAFAPAPAFGLSDLVIDQEFFVRRFPEVVTGVGVLWALAALLAAFAYKLNLLTTGEILFPNRQRRPPAEANPHFLRSFWGLHLLFLFLATLAMSLQVTEASFYELFDREGLSGAWRLWLGLTHPNFSLLAKAITEAIETILIAFLATVIAIPVAFFLAFFCAKNIMNNRVAFPFYVLLRVFMNVSRSVEPLIWALIFTVWVGVGPFAGMLALTIHSIASLAKYYSEILEGVADGPIDGIRSTGANAVQVVWFAIVPQIILPYIGMTIYRWDTNVRMATVIGLVGGGGIGTLLIQYQGQAMWPEVGCIILVIAVIVWLMDLASAYVREALK